MQHPSTKPRRTRPPASQERQRKQRERDKLRGLTDSLREALLAMKHRGLLRKTSVPDTLSTATEEQLLDTLLAAMHECSELITILESQSALSSPRIASGAGAGAGSQAQHALDTDSDSDSASDSDSSTGGDSLLPDEKQYAEQSMQNRTIRAVTAAALALAPTVTFADVFLHSTLGMAIFVFEPTGCRLVDINEFASKQPRITAAGSTRAEILSKRLDFLDITARDPVTVSVMSRLMQAVRGGQVVRFVSYGFHRSLFRPPSTNIDRSSLPRSIPAFVYLCYNWCSFETIRNVLTPVTFHTASLIDPQGECTDPDLIAYICGDHSLTPYLSLLPDGDIVFVIGLLGSMLHFQPSPLSDGFPWTFADTTGLVHGPATFPLSLPISAAQIHQPSSSSSSSSSHVVLPNMTAQSNQGGQIQDPASGFY